MVELGVEALGVRTESGRTLAELVGESAVLLVFLRHFGCSFCRKTISDVAELKGELAARGVRPVFVHLGTAAIAKAHFDYYGIGEVERVNDPEAKVYRLPEFGLRRVNAWWHLVNPLVWWGWLKGAIFTHGIGKIEGDGDQMPGVFFVREGRVVRGHVYRTIADEVDFLGLLRKVQVGGDFIRGS
jgi:hypothetical protein